MKKNVILALLFFLVLAGALAAREPVIIKVKVQMANVRSEPDTRAPVVAKVPGGTLLEVAGRAGDWFEVSVNDKAGREITGFIRNSVVEVIGAEEDEEPVRRRGSAGAARGSEMHFGLNFGVQTDDRFSFDPFLWTVGAELDFQFGKYLMLSPEVMLVGNGFEFKQFILYPAVILNLSAGGFFIGGGVG
ncbi:MAG TPA: SH3 domain-containing protein, partial [Candidatus Binatia bacterium]|nr:SH3 domain-containing protein [Candidatus Binatia bacterium]